MNGMPRTGLQKLIALLLLAATSGAALAQLPLVPSELSDHPLLQRFPDSVIVEGEFREDVNHTLVLGSLQRRREQVVPEAFERIRGNLTKLLYEIPQEFDGSDVYEFYREQMRERSYSELFSCVGRACGSSNYWANDIFRNRILYGPERNQFYVAMRTNLGMEIEPSISLYIITRANRRIYAYLEIIESGGELPPINVVEPDAVLSLLQENGSVILPGITFDNGDVLDGSSDLDYLVEILQSDPGMRVFLVGHLQGEQPFTQLMQRSLARAEVLRQALIARGIDGGRLSAQGVGPLAPTCVAGQCQARIEMVLQ